MQRKQYAVRFREAAALCLSILAGGCATLAQSQENFAKQQEGQGASAAVVASQHYASFMVYVVWVLGLAVSAIGGHFIVSPYVKAVKKYVNVKAKPIRFRVLAGCVERAVYTASFVSGWYSVIIILFALKIGQFAVSSLSLELKKTGGAANAYLLGNLLSVGTAILTGIIMNQVLARI